MGIIRRSLLFLLVHLFLSASGAESVHAQGLPHGYRTLYPIVGGVTVSCNNAQGIPVMLEVNNVLNDIGHSFPESALIQMNAVVADTLPNPVVQFWYAHECGHHALPAPYNYNESLVDCWAVKMLKRLGLLPTMAHVSTLTDALSRLPGNYLYLFGPQRAALVASCYFSQ